MYEKYQSNIAKYSGSHSAIILRPKRGLSVLSSVDKDVFWIGYEDGLYEYNYDGTERILKDEEGKRAITAEEMGAHKILIDNLVSGYSSMPKSQFVKELTKYSDKINTDLFLAHLVHEVDSKNMPLFSEQLHTITLLREGRADEAFKVSKSAISAYDINASEARWDIADKATYFTMPTLGNMMILLSFLARAQTIPLSVEEAVKDASDFATFRQILSEEMQLLGDPSTDLLSRAGCF